jgi:hypothetical protein
MRRRFVYFQSACGPNRTLSNGQLSLTINDNSGAISELLFGGSDWYNPGRPGAYFAIAFGDDFYLFTESQTTPEAKVCGSSSFISATYRELPLKVERRYTLASDANAFFVRTTIKNQTEDPVALRLAESFDPDQDIDQGGDFLTLNRLRELAEIPVTQATGLDTTYTVIMGSPTPGAVVEAAGGSNTDPPKVGYFLIETLQELDDFLDNPQNAEGRRGDLGIHCGITKTLAPAETFTFTMLQAFGLTVAAAEAAFLAALPQAN